MGDYVAEELRGTLSNRISGPTAHHMPWNNQPNGIDFFFVVENKYYQMR